MGSDRIVVVSADGHAGGPPSLYRDYIESKYLGDLDALQKENEDFTAACVSQSRYGQDTLDVIDPRGAIRSDGELGAWELDRRLAELDREGIAGELLLSQTQRSTTPFFSVVNLPHPADLRAAGVRAYHRFVADFTAASGGRLFGIAEDGPCLDMDDTVRELHSVAERGFIGVAVPRQVEDALLPPLVDSYWAPYWAACAELGLALVAHAGYGTVQGEFAVHTLREMMGHPDDETMIRTVMTADLGIDKLPYDSPARVAFVKPRRVLWQLMLSGALDRHPALRMVFTEVRADWVPDTLAQLDAAFDAGRFPSKRRPSEYWGTNFGVTASSIRPYEVAMRARIGVDRLMFGADYPHPEGTWPNTQDWIRASFAGVPVPDARRILGENAIHFFNLDRALLTRVAAEIGPRPSEVLGEGHHVDERLVEHFHFRSGYRRPAEQHDPGFIDSLINADIATVGM